MRVLVLGANGFVGSTILCFLQEQNISNLGLTRNDLDFRNENSYETLRRFIDQFLPNIIVNAIGSIDSKNTTSPLEIFCPIYLPCFYLFEYFKQNINLEPVKIVSFGSQASGEPRQDYPLYASIKQAEASLIITAREAFTEREITWDHIVLPRLKGGLGKGGSLNKISENESRNLILNEFKKSVSFYLN